MKQTEYWKPPKTNSALTFPWNEKFQGRVKNNFSSIAMRQKLSLYISG